MNLYSELKKLSSHDQLPCSILVNTNSVNAAFLELIAFAKEELDLDLNHYSQNSLIVKPEESGNINIDQIRKLKDLLHQTTTSQNKVAVILEADSMNINCYNACLKILEEPYGNAYIFLISKNIAKIIPTVQSRCYKIKSNYPEGANGRSYEGLIEAFTKKDMLVIFTKFDLKGNWGEFAQSCQMMISRMIKFKLEYNHEELSPEERLLFNKIKSSTEELLFCYDKINSAAADLDKYGLEYKSLAILIFNYIYEHFSN
jgi:DNA polymerase-3 subunit delta'